MTHNVVLVLSHGGEYIHSTTDNEESARDRAHEVLVALIDKLANGTFFPIEKGLYLKAADIVAIKTVAAS